MTDGVRIPPPGAPCDMTREAMVADMLGNVRGIVAGRRDPCYGALVISDDQVRELANAIVAQLLVSYDVRPIETPQTSAAAMAMRGRQRVGLDTAQGQARAEMMTVNHRGRR